MKILSMINLIVLSVLLSITLTQAVIFGSLAFLFLSLLSSFFSSWAEKHNREINEGIIGSSWVNPGKHAYPMYFLLSQSGGGKDTQAGKLLGLFQKNEVKYIYVSIGDCVRGLVSQIGSESIFAQRMKAINDDGKLQPPVMPLHFFLTKFIPEYTGEEVIIVNGSPRSYEELRLWAYLIQAGYLPDARIIHINVTDEECRKRLLGRHDGRVDTQNTKALETKLAWYQPIRIWLQKKLPTGVSLVTIDGMRTPDEVAGSIQQYFINEDVLF
jgi:adenylate kinase family enzyme